MAEPASWFVVEPGWKVLAADDHEVGKVHEMLGDRERDIFDGVAVSTGLLSRPVYVPAEQVGEIVQGTVRLNIGAEDVRRLSPYRSS